MSPFSAEDVLTTCGRHKERLVHVTDDIRGNAAITASRANTLLNLFGHQRHMRSGYRDPTSNAAAGGARYSWHTRGCAIDIDDLTGDLARFSTGSVLEQCGLWAEDASFTPGWFHVQTEPPRSGRRIFNP